MKKFDATKRYACAIEVQCNMSNPNGDPQSDNRPRMTNDDYGIITDVCLKSHVRDLVENKLGAYWLKVEQAFDIDVSKDNYHLLESKTRGYGDVTEAEALKKLKKEMKTSEDFDQRFWDARVFGKTALYDKSVQIVSRGACQITTMISDDVVELVEIQIARKNTLEDKNAKNENGTFGSKSVVRQATYRGKLFFNPNGVATDEDLSILFNAIPHLFRTNSSAVRPDVYVSSAYVLESDDALGNIVEEKEFFESVKNGTVDESNKKIINLFG